MRGGGGKSSDWKIFFGFVVHAASLTSNVSLHLLHNWHVSVTDNSNYVCQWRLNLLLMYNVEIFGMIAYWVINWIYLKKHHRHVSLNHQQHLLLSMETKLHTRRVKVCLYFGKHHRKFETFSEINADFNSSFMVIFSPFEIIVIKAKNSKFQSKLDSVIDCVCGSGTILWTELTCPKCV